LPSIRALLQACDNISPPEKKQKAVTVKLLRKLWRLASSRLRANLHDHAIDLIIGAFFFAMRSCEYTITKLPGKTKVMRLKSVRFRDRSMRTIRHSDPDLARRAEFVSVTFEDQKNGEKMDVRTQRKTGHPYLCPCLRLARAVQRVLLTVPSPSPDTPLCDIRLSPNSTSIVTSELTKNLLRFTCRTFGGMKTFGFHPHEIGNKSIRSGAAMALFLNNHSTPRIMLLGRWSSDAFLAYIRPQVLEWTNNMSSDMINFDSFLDAAFYDIAAPSDPRSPKHPRTLNGRSDIMLPRFNMHY